MSDQFLQYLTIAQENINDALGITRRFSAFADQRDQLERIAGALDAVRSQRAREVASSSAESLQRLFNVAVHPAKNGPGCYIDCSILNSEDNPYLGYTVARTLAGTLDLFNNCSAYTAKIEPDGTVVEATSIRYSLFSHQAVLMYPDAWPPNWHSEMKDRNIFENNLALLRAAGEKSQPAPAPAPNAP